MFWLLGAHGRDSVADLSTNQNTDVDSVSSSPGVQRVNISFLNDNFLLHVKY